MRIDRILLWSAMLTSVLISLWRLQPPSGDVGGFSTPAAMEHLRFIASEAHPVGTPHHAAIRAYLEEQFTKLGYTVQLQSARSAVPVTNVLARKAGTSPGNKAVMLAAHYDSSRFGPSSGAGDDGAAVAALLDVARILSQEPLRNDLIFLITDAEEMGLWGARVLIEQGHPWLDDVGIVLNFDARGTNGASIMFETSAGNGWLIDAFAKSAPHPVTSSLTYDVYKLLPNRTDFTIFREKGNLQGLNFAFIGSAVNYHTVNDDIDHLDQRSLRHHGIQALELARAFSQIDLTVPQPSSDDVYFDIWSLGVVRYPSSFAPFLAIGISILSLATVLAAIAKRRISFERVLTAVGMLGVSLLVTMGISWLIVRLTSNLQLGEVVDLVIAGYALLAILLSLAILRRRRRCTAAEQVAAGILLWTILAIVSAFTLRGTSYLTAWPLLGATIGLAVSLFPKLAPQRALVSFILLITALPALLVLTPSIYLAFVGLGIRLAYVLVAPIVLGMWLLPLQFSCHSSQGVTADAAS